MGEKRQFKPGNMLYPVPAALISAADSAGNTNLITLAWVGTICSEPPMLSISVKPERFSYRMIKETGEFVVNLTTEDMVRAVDFCGVKSGRDTDKWKETGLTPLPAQKVCAPLVAQSPVNLECVVEKIEELGSHHMFLARIVAVDADERYFDENGRFCLADAKLAAYSHGAYYGLGECLGTFGFSVRKAPGGAAGRDVPDKTRRKPALRQEGKGKR